MADSCAVTANSPLADPWSETVADSLIAELNSAPANATTIAIANSSTAASIWREPLIESDAEAASLTSAFRKAPASDANGAAANDEIPNTLRFGQSSFWEPAVL